jgi:hypothetical protein
MLKQAIMLTLKGRAVYIIGRDSGHNETMRTMLDALLIEDVHGPMNSIKFETLYTLDNFDPVKMKLIGAHPNCIVLVDHAVIESRYNLLIAELHRYDNED